MDNRRFIVQYLHLFPLFKELNRKEQEDLVSRCLYRTVKKTTYLYRQGDQLDRVFFLCQGRVRIYKVDDKGRDLILSIYTRAKTFPYDHFLSDHCHYSTNAVAEEDVEIFTIPIADLEQLLIKYPRMSIALLKIIGNQLNDMQFRLENKMLNTIEEQIVKLLIQLSKDHGITLSTKQILFLTPFQIKDLANMVGLSRETVSRVVTKLISKKLVARDKQGRFILTPAILKERYSIEK
ncbi:hypothetical protein BEP19_11845 [Ammoniphilus oxalaticus]|uniref:Crp/Fnr family transcriptional regulator n=1 Tax=Ammoniphilus oxalaticus TaxID=66863 RepID=A0A419SGL1_9BACL|nr:Crp/Fnr family transcriptional regulator [Ammoniphilus oxalaticus]RKD22920.1 hypothetical protein BEP19_11845 [Ammoniphilus oxalaticus]